MARPNKTAPLISAELLAKVPPLPEAGPLDTMDDLQSEWQRLHRGRDRHQIDTEKYRDLVYSLQVGTPITRVREELRELRRLQELLAAAQDNGVGLPALTFNELEPAVNGHDAAEVLP